MSKIYCEKHKKFSKVKKHIHEPDLKLDIMKIVAILECGCKLWIASAETNPEWLEKQR